MKKSSDKWLGSSTVILIWVNFPGFSWASCLVQDDRICLRAIFFPLWSLWEHLQLSTQSQKHLLHTYFSYLIGTAFANAGGAFPAPSKEAEGTRVQAPAPFLPVSLSLWSWRWFLENLLEDFLPWNWSSCYKIHCSSSAEKQPPLWPHSAEHLQFLAILLANLQARPVQSIISCFISLLYLSSESHSWFIVT